MNKLNSIAVSFLILLALFSSANASANNDLVLTSDGTVYLIKDSQMQGFPSLAVFYSYGYQLSQIRKATASDLSIPVGPVLSYANGSLILASDGTVYLIENNIKRGFTSEAAFLTRSYSFSSVIRDTGGILGQIQTGEEIYPMPKNDPLPPIGDLKVLSPNGGETVLISSKAFIKWQEKSGITAVSIFYRQCDACARQTIVTSLAVDASAEQTYLWDVPASLTLGANYKIEITGYDAAYAQVSDTSDSPFSVSASGSGTLRAVVAVGTADSATFVSGSKNVEFARIVLAAAAGNVTLTSLKAVYDGDAGLADKISIYHGERFLGSSASAGDISIDPLVIPNGGSVAIAVRADLLPSKSGSFRLGLSVRDTALYGNAMTVKPVGAFSIALDSSSPGARITKDGGVNILSTVFKVFAEGEDVSLESFAIKGDFSGAADVKKTSLWYGDVKLGEISGQSGVVNFSAPVKISKNSSILLSARVDLGEIDGVSVKINDTVGLAHDSASYRTTRATGLVSGQVIYPTYHQATGYKITLTNAAIKLLGDANQDGLVTLDDVASINDHISGQKVLSGQGLDSADVNGDGALTAADADLVGRYARLEIGAFPRVLGALLQY